VAFQDVTRSSHRRHEAPRSYPSDINDPERVVEANDEDRETHPDRVNGRRVREQQAFARAKGAAPQQSRPAFPRCRGNATRKLDVQCDEEHLIHRRTVARGSDEAWGGQDSNPRHEG
jgi:hypothetical protein